MATSITAVVTPGSLALTQAFPLSSSNAFGNSLVQLAPVRHAVSQSKRLVATTRATRASLSKKDKKTEKKVLVSLLATGVALSVAGQALAGNPVGFAKSSGAQDPASNIEIIQDAKNAADSFVNETKIRIDGIFGKNKPLQSRATGGIRNAVEDAKKKISNFGFKNPIADNVNKATDDTKNTIAQIKTGNTGSARAGRELLGQDSTRVDEVTRKAKNLGDSFKNKASDAVDEAKSFAGAAQTETPKLPSLPNPIDSLNLGNNAQGFKEKAVDVKDDVASNLPNTPDLPNPLEGLTSDQNLNEKAADVKGTVASNANKAKDSVTSMAAGLKGIVSRKPT